MAPRVVALITAASDPYPWRRIQKGRRTLPRTSERVYRTLAFDVLHHGKFTSHVLRELANFCCLPGRAGGSPNGLGRWNPYRGRLEIPPVRTARNEVFMRLRKRFVICCVLLALIAPFRL